MVTEQRKQYKHTLENIWQKLYLMQNYNIDMSMFKGSNIRWSSIKTYLTFIRALYKGTQYQSKLTKHLQEYIIGLMDSGTEPYPKVSEKIITIKQLVDCGLLNNHEVDYIYSPVSSEDNEVDTSKAWNKMFTNPVSRDFKKENYTQIVEKLPENIESLNKNIKTKLFDIYKKSFYFKHN